MRDQYSLRRATFGLAIGICLVGGSVGRAAPPTTVEFNRDIRPILSDHCYACHGPDKNKRKADLRIDTEAGAFAERDGDVAIVKGKPAESALFARIAEGDAKKRMPPEKFGKPLTKEQIALVGRWIEQGAKYQKHWSLIAPVKVALPEGPSTVQPIDRFIQARLKQEGLKPAVEADRRTLIRRVYFDLLGLPPTQAEFKAALNDKSPDWYAKLVDQLLGSKHFGERLALYWLDLVRYADTGGYHSDNHRDVSLYRDWVINSFNDNKPFDRFTLEQLAGDLLPNASRDDRVASGYNRLLMTTEEGGAQAKEYTAKYAADRVRNVSSVWLGTTLGCCECHDHKFDPYSTREFYRFAAFFADIKEKAVGRQDQDKLPTPDQAARLKQLDEQIAPLQKTLTTDTPQLVQAQAEWEESILDRGTAGLPKEVAAAFVIDIAQRNPQQKQTVTNHFRGITPLLDEPRKQLAQLQKEKDSLNKVIPSTLVSSAVAPRVMRVLPRGNWLDDSGEIVAPGVPAALAPALDPKDKRANRLDLANWLTAPQNPLTARVFVNRLWKLTFGHGIVTSLEDFGAQGTWPTHLELLDWLAVDFVENRWDVKRTVKQIVLSHAYRQSSACSEELRHRDPYNHLLARQDRFRIDAEMVRDNALAVSGLLVRKIGGGSVKPYQPTGYWAMLNFPKREWQNDQGENLYRRGLYTYWCRTFPHPSLTAFDAPSREECTVERPRSNTPLQALVLLNDPIYVEAARALAERVLQEGKGSPADRIQFAYRQVLSRSAQAAEVEVVTELYEHHLKEYKGDKAALDALLKIGAHPAPKDIDPAELAAWTSVARVLLNLHETITRN